MSHMIGLDLGSATTLMVTDTSQKPLMTPTVAAVNLNNNEVMAVGQFAKQMIGRQPEGIKTVQPIRAGRVADQAVLSRFISDILQKNNLIGLFRRPKILAAVRFGTSDTEVRALEEALADAGASSVALVYSPLASLLGTQLPIQGNKGTIICDIGAGLTEVAVTTSKGMIAGNSSPSAGEKLSASIVSYYRSIHSADIGLMTAENLKTRIGSALPSFDKKDTVTVYGRLVRTGHTQEFTVSSAELREAMNDTINEIIDTIRNTLFDLPPTVSTDILDGGLILRGGTALLPGLATRISQDLNLRVIMPKMNPYWNVAYGLRRIIDGEIKSPILYYKPR